MMHECQHHHFTDWKERLPATFGHLQSYASSTYGYQPSPTIDWLLFRRASRARSSLRRLSQANCWSLTIGGLRKLLKSFNIQETLLKGGTRTMATFSAFKMRSKHWVSLQGSRLEATPSRMWVFAEYLCYFSEMSMRWPETNLLMQLADQFQQQLLLAKENKAGIQFFWLWICIVNNLRTTSPGQIPYTQCNR